MVKQLTLTGLEFLLAHSAQKDRYKVFERVGYERFTVGLLILKQDAKVSSTELSECVVKMYQASFCHASFCATPGALTFFDQLWQLFPLPFFHLTEKDLFSNVFLILCQDKHRTVLFHDLFAVLKQHHPTEFTFYTICNKLQYCDMNCIWEQVCVHWPEELKNIDNFKKIVACIDKPDKKTIAALKAVVPHLFLSESADLLCKTLRNSLNPMDSVVLITLSNSIQPSFFLQYVEAATIGVVHGHYSSTQMERLVDWFVFIQCLFQKTELACGTDPRVPLNAKCNLFVHLCLQHHSQPNIEEAMKFYVNVFPEILNLDETVQFISFHLKNPKLALSLHRIRELHQKKNFPQIYENVALGKRTLPFVQTVQPEKKVAKESPNRAMVRDRLAARLLQVPL